MAVPIQRIHKCSTKFLQPRFHQWMGLTNLGFIHGCAYPAHTRMQHQIPATRILPIKAYSAWHWANHDGRYNKQHTRHMLPAHYKRRLTSPATGIRGLVQHCPAGRRPRASLGDSACIHYTQERVTRLHLPRIKSNTCSYIKPVGTTIHASSMAVPIQRIHECSTKFLQPRFHQWMA